MGRCVILLIIHQITSKVGFIIVLPLKVFARRLSKPWA